MTPMRFPDEERIELAVDDPRWDSLDLSGLAETALDAVLVDQGLPAGSFSLSILACDDVRIADLNAEFRDKPAATNVLSWPSADRAPAKPGKHPRAPDPRDDDALGDIALAFDTCAAEAQAAGKSFEAHVLHLLLHSMLHLLGYDHQTDADAALMEGTESRILERLGQPDPYRANTDPNQNETMEKDNG